MTARSASWSRLAEAEPDEECILTADLDLVLLRRERHDFDPTGHYSRADVFDFSVDRRRRNTVTFTDA